MIVRTVCEGFKALEEVRAVIKICLSVIIVSNISVYASVLFFFFFLINACIFCIPVLQSFALDIVTATRK